MCPTLTSAARLEGVAKNNRKQQQAAHDSFLKIVKELREKQSKPKETYTCPICEKNITEIQGNSWCLDHDHKTKKFRGWLCHKCNRALGNFDDDIELLKKAIEYIKKDRNDDTNQTLL